MSTVARPPVGYRKTFPSLSEAAELLETTPTRMTRALQALGLTARQHNGREKYLDADQFLRVAGLERRISLQEAASALIEWVAKHDPGMVSSVEHEVDEFFAQRRSREPLSPEEFIAALYKELPAKYAAKAEEIYRLGASKTK